MNIILILVSIPVLAFGFDLKLTTPNHSTKWTTRSDVVVLWQVAKGNVNPTNITKIDLDLMIGPGDGVLIDNISFGVSLFQGNAEWIVDPDLSGRSDYFVRVTSEEDSKFKINGPRFRIARNGTALKGQNAASGRPSPGSIWGWQVAMLLGLITFILIQ